MFVRPIHSVQGPDEVEGKKSGCRELIQLVDPEVTPAGKGLAQKKPWEGNPEPKGEKGKVEHGSGSITERTKGGKSLRQKIRETKKPERKTRANKGKYLHVTG